MAGHEAAEHRRHSQRVAVVGEHGGAVGAAQRDVDVAAVAFTLVELGHEGQALAVLIGDLFGAVLVDGVVVAGDQGVVVAEGDLLLSEVALPLDAFAVHTRAIHAEADVAQQRFHAGGGQHLVVDVVVGGRRQASVVGFPGVTECVVEHHELEFGADVGDQPPLGETVHLAVENAARRLLDGLAVSPGQIRHHQRAAGNPRQQPQCAEVGGHHHVAVTGLPAGDGVAVDGVHVDVDGQQVVAAFGAVLGDVVDEQPRRDPLAGEPALHVGEGHDHRVDLARSNQLLEFGLRQHAFLCTHHFSSPRRRHGCLCWQVNHWLPAAGSSSPVFTGYPPPKGRTADLFKSYGPKASCTPRRVTRIANPTSLRRFGGVPLG